MKKAVKMVDVCCIGPAWGILNGWSFDCKAGQWELVPWVVAEALRALGVRLEVR